MYTVSCLCKGVRFEIHEEINQIYVCHCQQCQKAQGSAFVAVSVVTKSAIKWCSGQELLSHYASSVGKQRVFCSRCGSPLWSEKTDLPDIIRLRVGLINEVLNAEIYSHAFVENKVSWYPIPEDGSFKFKQKIQEK